MEAIQDVLSRLLLIRHGPSAHISWWHWSKREGVTSWRNAYDEAGIDPQATPPQGLVDAVASCSIVTCSDLLRASESANLMAPNRDVHRTHLLRESPLPVPRFPLPLPIVIWDTLATIHWGVRILRRNDPPPADASRAADAANWIQSVAGEAASAAVITHGVFRRVLAKHYLSAGWHLSKPPRSYDCWSIWKLERSL